MSSREIQNLRHEYRSLTRQQTRALLGVFISGGMSIGGFWYMASVAALNLRAVYTTTVQKASVKRKMREAGVKPSKWERISSILTGGLRKVTSAFITLGHDEAEHLVEHWGFGDLIVDLVDTAHPADGLRDHYAHAVGTGVEHAQGAVGWHEEATGRTNILPGAAAAATEYATGKADAAGRHMERQVAYRRR